MRALYKKFRALVLDVNVIYYRKVWKMNIGNGARLSMKCNLDKTNPKGIFVGKETYIAFGAVVLSHDFVRNMHVDTVIGERCFIGAHSLIMPGVHIGDNSIVGAGSVVTKSVPANVIVAGNPARVIKQGIKTTRFGKLQND